MTEFVNATDHFVNVQNIKRFRNLLETSVDETEQLAIQKFLTDEEAKQALHASTPQKE